MGPKAAIGGLGLMLLGVGVPNFFSLSWGWAGSVTFVGFVFVIISVSGWIFGRKPERLQLNVARPGQSITNARASEVSREDTVKFFKRKDRLGRKKAKGPSGLEPRSIGPRIVSQGTRYENNGGAGISTSNPNTTIISRGDVFKGNKKGGIVDESRGESN